MCSCLTMVSAQSGEYALIVNENILNCISLQVTMVPLETLGAELCATDENECFKLEIMPVALLF